MSAVEGMAVTGNRWEGDVDGRKAGIRMRDGREVLCFLVGFREGARAEGGKVGRKVAYFIGCGIGLEDSPKVDIIELRDGFRVGPRLGVRIVGMMFVGMRVVGLAVCK